jgi:hypothetical protein
MSSLGWPKSFVRGIFQATVGSGIALLTGVIFLIATFVADERSLVGLSDPGIWAVLGGIGAVFGWFVRFDRWQNPELFPDLGLSLAQAYWISGVVANNAIALIGYGIWGDHIPPIVMFLWSWYVVVHLITTWGAAGRYTGRLLWRGLAKTYVIILFPLAALFFCIFLWKMFSLIFASD